MVVECLRHVRSDIWKSERLAFVSAPGLIRALHVSCAELLGGKFTHGHRQMNVAYRSSYETDGSDPAAALQRRAASSMDASVCFESERDTKAFIPDLAFSLLLISIKTCRSVTVTSEASVRLEVSCFGCEQEQVKC